MKKLVVIGAIATLFIAQQAAAANDKLFDAKRVVAPIERQLTNFSAGQLKQLEPLIVNATASELQAKVKAKQLTYEQITAVYLARIQQYDQTGLQLNAVSEINPTALEEAKAHDGHEATSPLYGLPVIVKENIATANTMATSAGTLALKDWIAPADAKVVAQLKAQGAIILGKANMSEWAYFMSTNAPSGFSNKKGQVLNPYGPGKFDPSGSSSGSATVVAADFVPFAVGTETTGSIVAPANAQSVVGLRPTLGAVSGEGIIPLSTTLDTAGPMARTVEDTAYLYKAMTTNFTVPTWSKQALKGKKIGLLWPATGIDEPYATMLTNIQRSFEKAGAKVMTNLQVGSPDIDNTAILMNDFKVDVESFFKTYKTPVQTLDELMAFNNGNKQERAYYGQDLLEMANEVKRPANAADQADLMKRKARYQWNRYLLKAKYDAVVMIDTTHVMVSAVAGYPELAVPAGYMPDGQPYGITFVGLPNSEAKLFSLAYSFEQTHKGRTPWKTVVPQR